MRCHSIFRDDQYCSYQRSPAYFLGPVKQAPITALTANTSGQLFPNTSSTNVSGFSYIIPYGEIQECNIYGPICQTGSITVGVNLTSVTTKTVLPCSSHLSAQSAHLEYEHNPEDPRPGDFWSGNYNDGSDLSEREIKFSQSPECKSYAEAMSKGQYTFSDCGSSNTVIQTNGGLNFEYPLQIPPALARYFFPDYSGSCCGNCSLDIPEVRLYYFPEKTTDCHYNQTSNVTSTLQAGNMGKRIFSLVADESTAVISGHTL